jgi:hypothetical protein
MWSVEKDKQHVDNFLISPVYLRKLASMRLGALGKKAFCGKTGMISTFD